MVLHRVHPAYKADQHGGLRYAPRMPHPLAARWIEAQAPLPPASHAFFFEDDWKDLDALSGVRQKEESR